MSTSLPFAILAPVPAEHLESGLLVAAKEPFVAYGTRKWELLRKVDELRDDQTVPMLIYPSHEDEAASTGLTVAWFGWYIGHVDGKNGAHPDGMRFRPPTTAQYPADNKGHWASFWHITGLRKLPKEKQLTIGQIEGFKGGWRKEAPPRGPELVTVPSLLENEE